MKKTMLLLILHGQEEWIVRELGEEGLSHVMIAFVGQTNLCVQACIGPSTLQTRTLAATAQSRVRLGFNSLLLLFKMAPVL